MPSIKDAPVILTGSVMFYELTRNYETKEPTGAKVTIVSPDGAAVVKLSVEESQTLRPVTGQPVVWWVRNAPWTVESNSGMSTKFVRVVNVGDLDQLGSTLTADAKA